MGTLITILVVIHVFAAIVGIGPVFTFSVIMKQAKDGEQLRFVFKMMNKLNKFPKIGGITLLLSGVALMFVAKIGFQLMWLNISLILFVILEVIVIGFIEPKQKKVAEIVMNSTGKEIPKGFFESVKSMMPYQNMLHILTILILLLMIIKPSF